MNFSIYSIDGKVVVDQLMRYKSLEEDFREFMSHLGVKDNICYSEHECIRSEETAEHIAPTTTTS